MPIIFVQGPNELLTEDVVLNVDEPTDAGSSTTYYNSDSDTFSTGESFIDESKLDVKAILSKDFIGQALLQKGLAKSLNNSERDRLSDILVSHFLNNFQHQKLNFNVFRVLSNNIVKLLPTEKESTYFMPPILKKDSFRQKSEPARGKLIEKYRNKLHLVRTLQKLNSTEGTDADETENEIGMYIEF